jgi:glycosyltransferase involved in cell wall biosynthesis
MGADVRVGFVCPALKVGGAERFLAALVRALPARGVEASVVALNGRGRFFEELQSAGVDARFADVRSRYDAPGILRAYSMVKAGRPDVVVSQSVDAHVIGHLAARTASVPHIAIEHQQPELRPAAHRRALVRLVAPRVAAVVAVTGAQRGMLEAAGYSRDAIRVIPNGVGRPPITRERDDFRAELGAAGDEVLALLVATLRPEKDPVVFVDAVAEARRMGCRVRGVVAGSGSELALVERRARDAGGVTVLGERSDVSDLMAASDVVCLSSRAEALPMVVLEAMAVGRPILATDVGGLREVVTADVGRLVPPGSSLLFAEALCDFVAEPDRLDRMGHAAFRRYEERYTIDRMADAYLELLTDVAGAPMPRRRPRPVAKLG